MVSQAPSDLLDVSAACLNDNGESTLKRAAKAVVFAGLAAGCAALIAVVVKKKEEDA